MTDRPETIEEKFKEQGQQLRHAEELVYSLGVQVADDRRVIIALECRLAAALELQCNCGTSGANDA